MTGAERYLVDRRLLRAAVALDAVDLLDGQCVTLTPAGAGEHHDCTIGAVDLRVEAAPDEPPIGRGTRRARTLVIGPILLVLAAAAFVLGAQAQRSPAAPVEHTVPAAPAAPLPASAGPTSARVVVLSDSAPFLVRPRRARSTRSARPSNRDHRARVRRTPAAMAGAAPSAVARPQSGGVPIAPAIG